MTKIEQVAVRTARGRRDGHLRRRRLLAGSAAAIGLGLLLLAAPSHAQTPAKPPAAEVSVVAAVQKPINGSVFGASVEVPAWKTIPSWYVVSQEDRALNPDLERFYAKRIGA